MTTPENQPTRKPWLWLLAVAALVVLRLVLPFRGSDTMLAHSAVVDSLMNGHNWGRQALVGTLEYPLLPTLALLASRVFCAPFGLNPGFLLAAICQVWGAVYVFRLASTPKRKLAVAVGLVYAAAAHELFDALATADPNWVLAPLLGAAIYHLALWHRDRELRDAVLTAADVGLLAFAGPGGIALGFAVLGGMARHVSLTARGPKEERNGLKWMVWTPFCYCLALLLLWNWLVMDSPFFLLGRLGQALQGRTATHLIEATTGALGFELGWFVVASMLAAGLCLTPGHPLRTTASSLTLGLLAVVLVRTVCSALHLYPVGCGILLATGSLCLVGLSLVGADWQGHRPRMLAGVGLLVVGFLASHLTPGTGLREEARFAEGAPPPEEIATYIDQYWPSSRVAVYGMRTSAIYHDPQEKRFVARVDFHEGEFLEQASDEILHLLVPPDNNRYYPQGVSPFSSIATEGHSRLLLEKTWASGWQLWRCVVSPERHSPLQGL